jgi:hypothetical protein
MAEVDTDLGSLAKRASFALRNHLSSLMTLAHVLESSSPEGKESAEALRDTVVRLALDAEVVADLAAIASGPTGEAQPLMDLLREGVRTLRWLDELAGAPLTVSCAHTDVPDFLEPHEVVLTARRLIAALVARGAAEPIVLEVHAGPGSLLVAARRAACALEPDCLRELPAKGAVDELHLDLLAWALDRPGLRAKLLVQDGAALAAKLVRA